MKAGEGTENGRIGVRPGMTPSLVLLLGVIVGIGSMTTDMYFPAMPGLQRDFNVDAPAVQATLSVFLVGLAVGQLLFGPLSDRFGRRAPLLGGLLFYIAGCALAVAASELWVLLVARFLQALGAAAGLAIARAVITDMLEGSAAARMHNLTMQIMSAATIVAPMIGGWLVVASGWRAIFELLGGLGALSLVLAAWRIRETLPAERRSRSLLGGQVAAWKQLLGNRIYVLLVLSSSFTIAAMYALLMGSSFVFVDQFGWPADRYGLLYGCTTVAFIVVGVVNDRALRRYAPATLLAWALPAQLAGCGALMALALQEGLSALPLAAALFFLVGNLAFIHGNLIALVMEEARSVAGLGAGLLGAAQYGIAALAPAATGIVGGSPAVSMAAATLAFALLAIPCFLPARRTLSPASG